jgi:hypothetical protein
MPNIAMGLDAQIIAIGPFSRKVVKALEYPEADYAQVKEGATVVSNVFLAMTSEESHKLAACFGVGAMDLGRHELNSHVADEKKLAEVFDEENVRDFLVLRENGFKFYFLPNA